MNRPLTHIIVASIGNPEPYLSTLHSAGHIALECLRQEMGMPPFQRARPFGLKTVSLASSNERYTLLRSPMLMNDSGRWVKQVWRGAMMQESIKGGMPGLMLLHDMLNMQIGTLRIRQWESRHRGHNGLKSIENHLTRNEYPDEPLAKMAIGIGEPPSYVHQYLVDFLLRPLNKNQAEGLGRTGPLALKKLKETEKQWMAGPTTSSKKDRREAGKEQRGRG